MPPQLIMEQLINKQIGQYQVEALLGEGGMGAVYRAHDLKQGRMVALKIMLANLVNKPQFRSRFMQEAEAIASYSSPAIITILDTGIYNESPYIVMEYVEGGSLVDYLRQLDWSGTKPTMETVTMLAAQVAEGLSYAHQRGLIHRDIKPGNILLKMRAGSYQPRQAVIIDFGLAIQRQAGNDIDTAPFMGSLAYMSPEQCENKPLDGRSDIYALGILLYQLTTGQLPFQINAPADIMKHLEETPLPPSLINPDLPHILETITLKAMEKKPSDRYQSAAEMAHALRQALNNPEMQTAVLAQPGSQVVTQWLDNKWVAAIDVEERVDIHQTWTSLGENRLFITHQYEESQLVDLNKDEFTLGRDASNDIVLDDSSVSGKHIRLTRTPQGWQVSDLGSTNHSYLGDRLLEYEQTYEWPSTDVLRIGPYFLRWQPFDAEQHGTAPILASTALAATAVTTLSPAPDTTTAVAPTAATEPTYSDGEVLGIAITPPLLELEPGAQNLLDISVTNRDVTVKDITLRLEMDGYPPPWISLTDYQMKLLPDERQSTTALVDLSQDPTILAGIHTVQLLATTDKGEVEKREVQVAVSSLEDFNLDLHPSNLQEKVTCRLTIDDQSNFQNEYTVMGLDDSDALVFEFDEPQNAILTNFDEQQQQLKVAPRQEAWLGFRVRPRKRPLFGANKTLPFKIRVRTPQTDWQSLTGQVEISARITRRALLLLLLLLLLIGGTGYLAFYRYSTAQAERYAELENTIAALDAQIASGELSAEEQAAAEAERAAIQQQLEEVNVVVPTATATATVDPADTAATAAAAAAGEAAATAEAEAAAEAAAAEATAVAAAFTPTPAPNNPPTGIKFSSAAIQENVRIGTVVGEFTAVDPDIASTGSHTVGTVLYKGRLARLARQNEAFSYSLVAGSGDTHNDYFAIEGNQLVTAVEIDFEKTESLSFRVQVTDAAGASFAQSFTISVIDSDDIPKLSVSDITVSEADGSATITVAVSGDNFDTATVDYATADETAVAGTDYTTTSGTLTWEKGDTDAQTISVSLTDNEIDEADRTFAVTLSNAENAIIDNGTATVTLTDDDAEPTLAISDLTVNESVTGGFATVTVQLTGASSELVTVNYATSDITATAGDDYTASNGKLSWAAKTTGAKTFAIPIKADDIDEADETFLVVLSGSENAAISNSDAIITISDNNDAPKITIGDVIVTEGDTKITVPVTMTGKTSEEAWVEYSTSNGNGSNAATADFPDPDFDSISGRISWDAGTEGGKTISIQINEDDIDEVDQEFFVVSLYDNSTNVTVQDTVGNIYINDNDEKPTISLENLSASPVSEGSGTVAVAVTIVGRSSRPITLYYSTQNGTATAGADYTAVTNGTITWNALETSAKSIRLTILDDEIDESDEETFTLKLNSAENAQLHSTDSTTSIVIQDNDPAPVVSATVSNGGVDEDVVGGKAIVSVAIDRPSTRTITVTYTTVDETAVAGSDYVAKTQTLTWNPGETEPIPVAITINDDEIFEADETFIFRLQHVSSSATIDTADTRVAIRNDDPAPIITIVNSDPITVTEAVGTVNVLVALDRVTSIPVTVDWRTQDASAVAGKDYSAASGTITWNATTALTQTIPLSITEDIVDELAESFMLLLENEMVGTLSTASETTTITITDNDLAPVLEIGSITITEGNNSDNPDFLIPVTITGSSYQTVTVDYVIMGGTAVSGTDYIDNGTGTLTWSPEDNTVKEIPLQIQSDNRDEGISETIIVAIQNVNPLNAATIDTSTATSIITDDDDPPTINIDNVFVTEDVGSAIITATMTGESANDVSVNYSTPPTGTASAGTDYTFSSGTLTWPAGSEGAQTFTIPIIDDDEDERPYETIALALAGISPAGSASFAANTATLRVTDDDYTPIITTGQSRNVSEDAAAGNIGSPVSVTDSDSITFTNWTISAVDSIAGTTYFAVDNSSGQLSLTNAGATALDYETDTSYTLTLTVSDGTNTATPETVIINVQDVDDTAPVVTSNTGLTVDEGDTFTLTISELNATDLDSDDNLLLFTINSGLANGYIDNGIITGTTGITFTRQMLTANDVAYTHNGGDTTSDLFNFTVTDPANNAAASQNFNITINNINDAPVLDLGGINGSFTTTFTEDGGAVPIVDSDLTLTDSDTAMMTSATITINNIANGAAEVLAATVSSTGIVATYSSGVLTLTGPTTVANFQQVLRTITYNNTSQAPNTTTRNIQFVVNDGEDNSAVVVSTVTIIAQNDAPILDNSSNLTLTHVVSNTISPAGDLVSVVLASAGTNPITDADDGAVEGIAVIDDCVETPCSGTWQYSTNNGVTWIGFPANVAASRAVLLASNDFLRFIPNTNFTGTRTIQFRAWDQTSGVRGDTNIDTTTNGGTTAFSTATENATVTVTMN